MNTPKTLLTALCFLVLVGCQYDPFAHLYTTQEPEASDLVGTYEFERQTFDYNLESFVDSLGKELHPQITLNADGTFDVVDLPNVSGEIITPVLDGYVTASGTWKVASVGSIGDGSGNTKTHWGIYMPELPFELRNGGLINNEAPHKIIFGFGDPDSGYAIIFKKNPKLP